MWIKCLILNYALPLMALLLTIFQLIPTFISNLTLTLTLENSNTSIYRIHRDYELANDICRFTSVFPPIKKTIDKSLITFVTQGSIDHIPDLIKLADRWNGPISAAIYIPSANINHMTLSRLFKVFKCHNSLRNRVDVQLFHQKRPKGCKKTGIVVSNLSHNFENISCNSLKKDIEQMVELGLSSRTKYYPVNSGRNLARLESKTELILIADIELAPSANMHDQFRSFIRNENLSHLSKNQVYVFPVFEVKNASGDMNTVLDLYDKSKGHTTVPFHRFRAYHCHKIPRLSDWAAYGESVMKILYSTKWIKPCWEPVFISHNNIPLHDERFRGYGRNKIQQAYEMCRTDFSFNIMTTGFFVHQNISMMSQARWNTISETVTHNNKLFNNFKRELDSFYPGTALISHCDDDSTRRY